MFPTEHFTILLHENPSIDASELQKKFVNYQALKKLNAPSGCHLIVPRKKEKHISKDRYFQPAHK